MRGLQLSEVRKRFASGAGVGPLSLQLAPGTMLGLLGPSGSGKTTLLRLMGGLDAIVDGKITLNGRAVGVGRAVTHTAYLAQKAQLIGRRTVLANVLAGRLGRIARWRGLAERFSEQDYALAQQALEHVGLASAAMQRADTLSGGEQQRAALARAMVQEAQMLLADEPVASLDPDNAVRVLQLLRDRADAGCIVVCALHQPELAHRFCHRVLRLEHGREVSAPTSLAWP